MSVIGMTFGKGSNESTTSAENSQPACHGDHSGWVYKQGSLVKNWKRRFMVLKGQQLTYYDTEHIYAVKTKQKGSFQVIAVELSSEIQNGLLVHGRGGRVLKLYTDTAEEASGWYRAVVELTVGCMGSVANVHSEGDTRVSSMPLQLKDRFDENVDIVDMTKEYEDDVGYSDPLESNEAHVIHSGWLLKEGNRIKTWKRRFFHLRGNTLSYFASEDTGAAAKGFGRVCAVEVDGQRGYCLGVHFCSGRLLRILAESQNDMEVWLCKLSDAVQLSNMERRRDSLAAAKRPLPVNLRSSVPYLKRPAVPEQRRSSMTRSSDPFSRHTVASVSADKTDNIQSSSQDRSYEKMSSRISEFDDDDDSDGDWI